MHGIIIAGPTASGKSALAFKLASQHQNSVIINADSRQVYDALHILSAHPSKLELTQIPHKLYSYKCLSETYSVYQWLEDVAQVLKEPNIFPIVVGGTGLYIQALLEGLAPLPARPTHILENTSNKQHIQQEFEQLKARINSTQLDHIKDLRRMERILSIYETNKQLPSANKQLVVDHQWHKIYVDSNNLDNRILTRLKRDIDLMIEEVRCLNHENIKLHIGVKQILEGGTKEEILQKIFYKTRQYAKRQRTWFKKYYPADEIIINE